MATEQVPRRRADARRNEEALLDAAAAAFVASGVEAPVRDIAARAGVGVGTVYRHFPTRADLVVAVYRHQVEALRRGGRDRARRPSAPYDALVRWIDGFVDFLVTKHGLAGALRDGDGFEGLHDYFLDRLVPACAALLGGGRRRGRGPRRRRGPRAHARRREPLHRGRTTPATTRGGSSASSSRGCAGHRRRTSHRGARRGVPIVDRT